MPRTVRNALRGNNPEEPEVTEVLVGDRVTLERFLYVFKAPVVLHPPEERWPIPRSLAERVVPSRLEAVAFGEYDMGLASLADTVIYLYSYALKFPPSRKWAEIYAYYADKLFGGTISKARSDLVPKDLGWYEGDALLLRQDIFRKQKAFLRKMIEGKPKPDLRLTVEKIISGLPQDAVQAIVAICKRRG